MIVEKSATPSGRDAPDHGPTIDPDTRAVRRTSVSQLQEADGSTNEGCLRKWFYHKVLGIDEASTAAQDTGTEHHGYTERYLLTGEPRLPDRIVRNLHFVPKPGPDLLVEHPTIPTMSDGSSGLAYAPLRAAGIPVVGYIDCIHGRRTNLGGSDIEDTLDPEGTIEIIDWKFTGSMDYAKSGPDLVKTIQMSGYGKYRFDVGWPGDLVRLSHGYMPARGRGDKRTIRVDRAAIEKSWEHAEGVMRSMVDAARETDANLVTANRKACNAFRKKCIHAVGGYCTAGTHNSLRTITGDATSKKDSMGLTLLDRIRGAGAAPSATVALTGVPAQTTVSATPTPDDVAAEAARVAAAQALVAAKDAEIAKLKAEEQLKRAARAFELIFDKVVAHGMGTPALAGDVAALMQAARPAAVDALKGSGQIAQPGPDGSIYTVSTVAEIEELLGELDQLAAQKAEAAKGAPAPVAAVPSILSPETPAPVSTPVPAVVPTTPAVAAPAPVTPAGAEAAKPRRGRPPGSTNVAKAAGAPVAAAPSTGAIYLVVDTSVEGLNTTSLHGLVDEWCGALAREYDAADIRCAPEKSPLGFGKWPGAIVAFVRETAVELPAGWYSLDSRGGQVIELIIEALRPIILASGGALIRGHR